MRAAFRRWFRRDDLPERSRHRAWLLAFVGLAGHGASPGAGGGALAAITASLRAEPLDDPSQ